MGVIHELVETVSPDTVYDAVYYFFCNNSLISRKAAEKEIGIDRP